MPNQTEKKDMLTGILDCQISRRKFLFMGAAAISTVTIASLLPGISFVADVASYDGMKIGNLSDLRLGQPMDFRYPWDHPNCSSNLIKLGAPAGGGIGPEQDVVAFNTLCTHMGISLQGTYKSEYRAMGPCPAHLTTYDLTRHGIVIAGHATQGLPQVLIEQRGDEIWATGMMGLIYGFNDNEVSPIT